MTAFRHIVVVGPTASGKSSLAMALAEQESAFEIISADSMQVYRGMDIGTAKPTAAERERVVHHCLDLADPSETFSIVDFQQAASLALADIESRGKTAIVVGGSGLYVHALVDGLKPPRSFPEIRTELEANPDTAGLYAELVATDPDAAAKMEPTNRRRIVRALEVTRGTGELFSASGDGVTQFGETKFRLFGVWRTRATIGEAIAARYEQQLREGFVDEVRQLAKGELSHTARQALGYRELLTHLEDDVPLDEAVALAVQRTKSFARRQRMWFRRDPRITWLGTGDSAAHLAPEILKEWQAWN